MRPHLTRWVVEPAPRGGRQLTVATRRASGRSSRSTNAHAQWPRKVKPEPLTTRFPRSRGPLSHLIGDGVAVPRSRCRPSTVSPENAYLASGNGALNSSSESSSKGGRLLSVTGRSNPGRRARLALEVQQRAPVRARRAPLAHLQGWLRHIAGHGTPTAPHADGTRSSGGSGNALVSLSTKRLGSPRAPTAARSTCPCSSCRIGSRPCPPHARSVEPTRSLSGPHVNDGLITPTSSLRHHQAGRVRPPRVV